MKFFKLCVLAFVMSTSFVTLKAQQHQLPPAWNGNTNSVQFDNRTRAYISPVRVMWTQTTGDATITNPECLLKQGNGQSMLGANDLCHLTNGKTGQVSLLLDFGRELHGGIQIITGMSD